MKRYQVFISSTYVDLKNERAAVLRSILELECFPAGMELFPSASLNQFEYIKGVIDDSDYYIVIVGGRYGDDSTGLSYTEQEFDYAYSKGIPILAFLHKHPEDIPAKFYELDIAKREKLQQFRRKIENGRIVSFWSNPDELASKVLVSLQNAIKKFPRQGWEKSLDISNTDLLQDTIRLKTVNYDLTKELEAAKQIIEEMQAQNLARKDDFWKQNVHLSGLYSSPTNDTVEYNQDVSIRLIFTLWYPHILSVSLDVQAEEQLSESIGAHFGIYHLKIDKSCYSFIKNLLVHAGVIAEFTVTRNFGGIVDNVVLTKKGKQVWNQLNQ